MKSKKFNCKKYWLVYKSIIVSIDFKQNWGCPHKYTSCENAGKKNTPSELCKEYVFSWKMSYSECPQGFNILRTGTCSAKYHATFLQWFFWCDQNWAFHSLAGLNLAVIIELRLIWAALNLAYHTSALA